jgi:glycerophosphoryl diester phosphodiesterase
MAGLDWLCARPIAHRGLHGEGLIENTLGAAAAAVAGNYGIEVDLQLTADGEVVVFHDDTLDRLTAGVGPVNARTLAELKALSLRASSERIPTLQELLDRVAGRTPLVLELKSEWNGDDRLAARIAAQLMSYAGPVAAMSFDPDLVAALAEHAPGLPRGIVAERHFRKSDWPQLSIPRRLALGHLTHFFRTRPHFIAYSVSDLPALAPLLCRHVCGMPILTWTVRSEAERRRARWWANQVIFEGFRPGA